MIDAGHLRPSFHFTTFQIGSYLLQIANGYGKARRQIDGMHNVPRLGNSRRHILADAQNR